MRRVFPHYKKDFEMACKVMKAMAEEIVKLRMENAGHKQRIRELEGIIEEQGEELFNLRSDVSAAKAALNWAK